MTSLPEIDVDMALLAMPFVDVLQPPWAFLSFAGPCASKTYA